MTEPPSGVRSRTLLEFLAYPLRVGVSQFLEDAERPLPRGRRSTSTGTGRGVCVAEADQGIGHVQAVTHLLEDCDRSLVRRDRPAVIPLVAVDVSEAVPGCSLAGLVALLLLHRQGLLAGRECFVVPAEHGQRPAHRVERVRLSDIIRCPADVGTGEHTMDSRLPGLVAKLREGLQGGALRDNAVVEMSLVKEVVRETPGELPRVPVRLSLGRLRYHRQQRAMFPCEPGHR